MSMVSLYADVCLIVPSRWFTVFVCEGLFGHYLSTVACALEISLLKSVAVPASRHERSL